MTLPESWYDRRYRHRAEAGEQALRVVFVEAERVLAEALAARLSAEPDIEDVRVTSGPEALGAVLDQVSPHVVVLALDSTAFIGASVIEGVTSRRDPPRILALTRRADPYAVVQTLWSGVHGWLPLAEPIESLLAALRAVATGDYWLPTSMVSGVLRELARPGRPTPRLRLSGLSDRERQVLAYATEGLNRTEIATRLGVSPNTVRCHMQRVLAKLGVHSTLEAVTLTLKEGWVPTLSAVPTRESRARHPTGRTQIAGVVRAGFRPRADDAHARRTIVSSGAVRTGGNDQGSDRNDERYRGKGARP